MILAARVAEPSAPRVLRVQSFAVGFYRRDDFTGADGRKFSSRHSSIVTLPV